MRAAAAYFIGLQDVRCFTYAEKDQYIRTIFNVDIEQ